MASSSEQSTVAGILLAAGSSSRLGRPKQLLPINGQPLIRRVTEAVCATRLRPVVVVTGSHAEQITDTVRNLEVVVIHNADYHQGQSTSMIAGLSAVPNEAIGAVFLLGDQPQITAEVIDQVVSVATQTGAAIAQTRYRGIPSHPVYFARSLFPELLQVTGDLGARDVIRRHVDAIHWVDVDSELPLDIDTEADYDRVLTDLEPN